MEADAPTEVAAVVRRAAQQWSPKTHELFPAAARSRAVTLLVLGHRLAHDKDGRFGREAEALFHVWVGDVMRFVITRDE